MKKGISIKIRLTIMVTILLTLCCVGLTIVLNISANKMVDKIEPMIPLYPSIDSTIITDDNTTLNNVSATIISKSAKKSYYNESIIYMLIIVVIGAAATYYISGKALKPLYNLNNKIKNKTINNLNEVLDIPNTNDEIAELTKSFNKMSNKLNEVFVMQNLFSSNVAHELRTPLTVLKTKIDVFNKEKNHTNDDYGALINIIDKNTCRLSEIVVNLLDLTNDNQDNYNDIVDLKDIIENVVDELTPIALNKNVTFNLNCLALTMKGNHDLLYQLFYNIIENSIKYNNDYGNININISDTKNIIVNIIDTGIGIEDEYKEAIFEPFYRIDKSRSRQIGGAGLGLAIANKIIKNHNGKITILDNKPKGTCFKIEFNKNSF